MAYKQTNNPYKVTPCGRRRTFMQDSPLNKLRKTTKGKGRHFLTAKEGAGMTAAGRAAYNKETGGNLKACLLYTSDAADDSLRVDLGGRRIIKK